MYYFYTTKIAILQFYFNTRNFLYQSFILYEECAKSVKISKKKYLILRLKNIAIKIKKKSNTTNNLYYNLDDTSK